MSVDTTAPSEAGERADAPYAGWPTVRLGAACTLLSGATPPRTNAAYWGGDTPWISAKDLHTSRIHGSIDNVSELAIEDGIRIVPPGTLLVLVRGMALAKRLPVSVVEREACFNQDVKAFVTAPNLSTEFLFRWLQANCREVLRLATEATHGTKRLPTADLLGLTIPLPPLPEQRAIAEALSDVDRLIDALEALIAKKRDIKQATMQQLLTGKTRLPGFTGEWERRQLASDVLLVSGRHIAAGKCNTAGNGTPYLTGPADFVNGTIQHTKYTTQPDIMCEAGDVLLTVKGSGCGTMITADDSYCISRQLMALRTDRWNAGFLYYSLLQNADTIAAASAGLIPGLSRADILGQRLPVPTEFDEQSAIADVLSDMDAEIEALEARLDKTRMIKTGMMQQLLTGRIRLVEPEAAA